jgi:hypothetical protein
MGGKKGAALCGVAGATIGVIAGPALLVPTAVGALLYGIVLLIMVFQAFQQRKA